MNTNLIHNILNVLIALIAAMTTILLSTGCVTLETGALDCSESWINPEWSAMIVTGMALAKTAINVVRDGITGLVKPQPPVQR